MPTRTTIAAVSGLVSGICLAAAAVDGVSDDSLVELLAQTIAVGFFPTVVVSLIVSNVFRRQMAAHEARGRRQVKAITELRRQATEEFDRRAAELREREERLNMQAALNDGQTRTLVEQLREARAQRDAALRERDRIRVDFDALAAEYNGMVLGEVDERSAQFTRQRPRRSAGRERHRETGTAEGCPAVVKIGRQAPPEPDQHARPAEA
jgi:hypothetical protein